MLRVSVYRGADKKGVILGLPGVYLGWLAGGWGAIIAGYYLLSVVLGSSIFSILLAVVLFFGWFKLVIQTQKRYGRKGIKERIARGQMPEVIKCGMTPSSKFAFYKYVSQLEKDGKA